MRCVGIDPSSSCSAAALVEGAALLETWAWFPTKGKSDVWNLHDYYWSLKRWLRPRSFEEPIAPMACVEFLSVTRNMNAVRQVSHYQAASALACKQAGLVVIEARVSSARKEALGRGNYSKDESWEIIKKRYPQHKFLAKNRGGTDEADAVVLGLAGPGLAER